MAEYVMSMQGKRKLLYGGYAYIAETISEKREKQYWRCARRGACKARVHTLNEEVVKFVGEHIHLPDPALRTVLSTVSELKEKAVTSPRPVNDLVAETLAGLDPAVISQLPPIESLRRSIHRARQKSSNSVDFMNLTNPDSRKTLLIPEIYKLTSSGEDFLLFDSGDQQDDRTLIFSTHSNLEFLSTSTHWILDSSFRTLPELFHQLFVILVVHGGKLLPLAYILIPDDKENTYKMVIEMLLLIQSQLHPERISVEFNQNYVEPFKEKFPNAIIEGRIYNLCELLFKRIVVEGLQEKYQNDLAFSIKIRMLSGLAFVPLTDVRDVFEMISQDFPKEAVNVLGYFEDTFIGRYRKRFGQEEPVFAVSMWNLHDKVGPDMIISNTLIEDWHHSLQMLFGNQKVTVWKFFKSLNERQDITREKVQQLLSESTVHKATKKKCHENQKFIVNTVNKYHTMEPLTFLHLIASNIGR